MTEKKVILETERLILRRYVKEDLPDLHAYLSDAEVVKYEPYEVMDMCDVARELDERILSEEMIAVELKTTHVLIGNVYLGKREYNSLEIGYVFNRQYWGQGYAKESCNALIMKSFSEGIHRIYAECDPQNANSWKLLESLGFIREGYFKQNVYFWMDENGNPVWKDTFVYALLNDRNTADAQ